MDSKKKYDQMVEDGEIKTNKAKFIWVLDFEDGEVYRYNIDALNNTGWSNDQWNPDHEACESFLIGAGHSLGNIEWMVLQEKHLEEYLKDISNDNTNKE